MTHTPCSPQKKQWLSRKPRLLATLGLFIFVASTVAAQPTVVGVWRGVLMPDSQKIEVIFHLSHDSDGSMQGSMNVPAQGAQGIALNNIILDGRTLSMEFQVPGGGSFEGVIDDAGERIEGHFSQGPNKIPLTLQRSETTAASAAPARPQEPSAPFPYLVEEVSVDVGADVKLAGTLTRPKSEGPHPGAVLISGAGPHDRDGSMMGHRAFLVLADALTRAGIAVLRLDERGVGESTGDFASASIRDLAADAVASLSFLGGKSFVDRGRVGLIAHSQGGVVAGLASEEAELAYLVLLAPVGRAAADSLDDGADEEPETMREVNAKVQRALGRLLLEQAGAGQSPELTTEQVEGAVSAVVNALPASLMEQAKGVFSPAMLAQVTNRLQDPETRFRFQHDPLEALRKFTAPALVLFGGVDQVQSFELNASPIAGAFEEADNPDATVLSISGLNHFFQEAPEGEEMSPAQIEQTFSPRALDVVVAWISSRFLGTGG